MTLRPRRFSGYFNKTKTAVISGTRCVTSNVVFISVFPSVYSSLHRYVVECLPLESGCSNCVQSRNEGRWRRLSLANTKHNRHPPEKKVTQSSTLTPHLFFHGDALCPLRALFSPLGRTMSRFRFFFFAVVNCIFLFLGLDRERETLQLKAVPSYWATKMSQRVVDGPLVCPWVRRRFEIRVRSLEIVMVCVCVLLLGLTKKRSHFLAAFTKNGRNRFLFLSRRWAIVFSMTANRPFASAIVLFFRPFPSGGVE